MELSPKVQSEARRLGYEWADQQIAKAKDDWFKKLWDLPEDLHREDGRTWSGTDSSTTNHKETAIPFPLLRKDRRD